jgi:membrane-bound serine protease (ClpP class)
MVDFDVELWEVTVDGEIKALTLSELERLERDRRSGVERVGIISEPGKLLSLTAGEALRFGLLAGIAESQEDLAEALGVRGEFTMSSPSAADSVVSFLTSGAVQALLILLGLVMIFLEIQSPGFGIPGIIAVLAFLVVFGSSALLGRVGSLEILLFLIGVGLLAVEIFVLPGFGVAGISGLIIIGLSLMLSMQDFTVPRFAWEWALMGRNALVVFVALIASVTGIAIIALLGPKVKMFDVLTLKTAITGTAGGPDPESVLAKTIVVEKPIVPEDGENFAALLGKTGVANTILRPSGRAMIDGKIYSVDADYEFVDEGSDIVVTRVYGNRIVVRKV